MAALFQSLHARMLAMSAAATLTALAVAGWSISGILEHFVIEGLDRRLDADVALLASFVNAEGHVDKQRLCQRLSALESGPGWRWQIVGPDGRTGSSDFPRLDDGPPRPPVPPGPGLVEHAPLPIPADDHLRPKDGATENGQAVHARQLTIETTGGPVTLTVAAPRSIISSPIRAAVVPLLATLVALAVLLGTAALMQLRFGLRPLRRLRDEVAAIGRGTCDRVSEDQPTELQPLAAELNALTAENAAALAAARLSAANLAHALKTPVATLALEVGDQPAQAAQVARIDATIRRHLARARLETINRRVYTPLSPAVDNLVSTIRRIHADRDLTMEVDVPANLMAAIDPHDLDEIVGNLLDNAARHAGHRVGLKASCAVADARVVTIEVWDDGPGIPAAERSRVVQPGQRLDESGSGHGFGLAIVRELVSLYGGSITLNEAPGGGLLAVVELPTLSR